MYIIIVNNELFVRKNNKNVMNNKEELFEEMKLWSCGKELIDEDGDVVLINDMIDGGEYDIVNEEMVEMGDDYVGIRICKLD